MNELRKEDFRIYVEDFDTKTDGWQTDYKAYSKALEAENKGLREWLDEMSEVKTVFGIEDMINFANFYSSDYHGTISIKDVMEYANDKKEEVRKDEFCNLSQTDKIVWFKNQINKYMYTDAKKELTKQLTEEGKK